METKKHKQIKIEDFKGVSDIQLSKLITGAKFLFSPPDPSKAAPKSKRKSKQAGEITPEE